jgi:hypothetical protein
MAIAAMALKLLLGRVFQTMLADLTFRKAALIPTTLQTVKQYGNQS